MDISVMLNRLEIQDWGKYNGKISALLLFEQMPSILACIKSDSQIWQLIRSSNVQMVLNAIEETNDPMKVIHDLIEVSGRKSLFMVIDGLTLPMCFPKIYPDVLLLRLDETTDSFYYLQKELADGHQKWELSSLIVGKKDYFVPAFFHNSQWTMYRPGGPVLFEDWQDFSEHCFTIKVVPHIAVYLKRELKAKQDAEVCSRANAQNCNENQASFDKISSSRGMRVECSGISRNYKDLPKDEHQHKMKNNEDDTCEDRHHGSFTNTKNLRQTNTFTKSDAKKEDKSGKRPNEDEISLHESKSTLFEDDESEDSSSDEEIIVPRLKYKQISSKTNDKNSSISEICRMNSQETTKTNNEGGLNCHDLDESSSSLDKDSSSSDSSEKAKTGQKKWYDELNLREILMSDESSSDDLRTSPEEIDFIMQCLKGEVSKERIAIENERYKKKFEEKSEKKSIRKEKSNSNKNTAGNFSVSDNCINKKIKVKPKNTDSSTPQLESSRSPWTFPQKESKFLGLFDMSVEEDESLRRILEFGHPKDPKKPGAKC